jgi:hypothetical protein
MLAAQRWSPVILLAFLRLYHSFLASGTVLNPSYCISRSSFYLLLSFFLHDVLWCPEPRCANRTSLVIWPEAGRGYSTSTALPARNLSPTLQKRIGFPLSHTRQHRFLQRPFPPTQFLAPLCGRNNRRHSPPLTSVVSPLLDHPSSLLLSLAHTRSTLYEGSPRNGGILSAFLGATKRLQNT